jgi:hypothetical protein
VLSTLLFLASLQELMLTSLHLPAFLLLMVSMLFAGIHSIAGGPSVAGVPAIAESLLLF